jgi:hypothetical protein
VLTSAQTPCRLLMPRPQYSCKASGIMNGYFDGIMNGSPSISPFVFLDGYFDGRPSISALVCLKRPGRVEIDVTYTFEFITRICAQGRRAWPRYEWAGLMGGAICMILRMLNIKHRLK